jgi:hypothetical protein
MATFINPFISDHVQNLLWPAEIAEFGRQVQYLPEGDALQAQTITIIWVEGAHDEEVSPGRYSHIKLRNADLAVPPGYGDTVQKDGKEYSVARIEALAVYFSIIVLQESGAVL